MVQCASNKVDSNITGLAIAEEQCLKQLPDTPVWYGREPNSYSDFGGEITTTARSPIISSRQKQKGVVTDMSASGGYNEDFTPTNFIRLLQGFMFADAREQPTTKPLNAAQNVILSTSAKDLSYKATSAFNGFEVNDLVHASGFNVPTNNGLKRISGIGENAIAVWGNMADETPSDNAVVTRVGREFESGDVVCYYENGVFRLVANKGTFDGLKLIGGAWLFLGGDADENNIGSNIGFARVSSVSSDNKTVYFDLTTWYPSSDKGEGKKVRVYVGTVIRNESDPSLIKRRSYQLERTLGTDAYGMQSEYIIGAVPDEFKLTIPQADKMTADLTYTACDYEQRNGTQGLKSGVRVAATSEDAYNSTSDVYRTRMVVKSATSTNPNALFGYISEGSIDVKNNLSANKAVGVLGAFDMSAGTFEVTGSVTAYFTDVAATQAIRNNADVGWHSIYVKGSANKGAIYDLPLISLGGGRISIEADNPITIPIDTNAAESSFGHTLLTEFFQYLPNKAATK